MTQTKIKIYLVKKLDSSHWMNFWVFIRFLMRLSMPSMLCVTNYNHKICSKTISYVQSKWNTNHHKRWQKKSEGAYAQHKRRTYNLKGPRAARTCLVTLKRGLLTIQLVGSGGHSLATHYGKKIFPRSLSCTQSTIIKVPIKILAIFLLESFSIISISYLILTKVGKENKKNKRDC